MRKQDPVVTSNSGMLKLVKRNLIQNPFSVKLFNINARSKTSKKSTMESTTVHREWIRNPYYRNYKRKNDETELTIMSYNILAQDLIDKHSYLYDKHNSQDLSYDVRSQKIFQEIKRIQPDILCLQEMQESHLMDFKLKCFSIDLHEVIFKKRTQEGLTDRCAIFFNSDMMELVDEQKVEYFQPNAYVLNRSNVAIIAKFRLKNSPNSELVIATTHLLYNPRRQDVRLAQTQILLAEIDRIAFRGIDERRRTQYLPVILTGDFNFQPDTAPYGLIANGCLKYNSLNKRLQQPNEFDESMFGNVLLPIELGVTDNCQHFDRNSTMLYNSEKPQDRQLVVPIDTLKSSCLPFETGFSSHQLNFCSVYEDGKSSSTYQNQWILVYYIFYRKQLTLTNQFVETNLKLMARFELPTRQQCFYHLPYGGIPNQSQGSDHFSLATKFLLSSCSSSAT